MISAASAIEEVIHDVRAIRGGSAAVGQSTIDFITRADARWFSPKFSSRQHRSPAVILGAGLVATGRRLQDRTLALSLVVYLRADAEDSGFS